MAYNATVHANITQWLEDYRAADAKGDTRARAYAESQLVQANVPLIITRVKYLRRRTRTEMPEEDLIQAGSIGLVRALSRFNGDRKQWYNYAGAWIDAELRLCVQRDAGVFRPTKHVMPGKVAKKWRDFVAAHDREPTAVEIGEDAHKLEIWRDVPTVICTPQQENHPTEGLHEGRQDSRVPAMFVDTSPGPEDLTLDEERRHLVRLALEGAPLTKAERRLARDVFVMDRPMRALGTRMEDAESVLGSAVTKMREWLDA